MDFGAPNQAAMSNPSDLIWITADSQYQHWTSTVGGMKWSGTDTVPVTFTNQVGLTDTGSSCIVGPRASIEPIQTTIYNKITNKVANSNWDYIFSCSQINNLDSFFLQYGDYWFEIRPQDYIVPLNAFGTCGLCLQYQKAQDIGYWILGDVFLRDWYSIHSYSPMRMGFVPAANSGRSVPTQAQPTTSTDGSNNGQSSGDSSGQSQSGGLSQENINIIVGCVVAGLFLGIILLIIFCPVVFFNFV